MQGPTLLLASPNDVMIAALRTRQLEANQLLTSRSLAGSLESIQHGHAPLLLPLEQKHSVQQKDLTQAAGTLGTLVPYETWAVS